jgi:hypothetical protein
MQKSCRTAWRLLGLELLVLARVVMVRRRVTRRAAAGADEVEVDAPPCLFIIVLILRLVAIGATWTPDDRVVEAVDAAPARARAAASMVFCANLASRSKEERGRGVSVSGCGSLIRATREVAVRRCLTGCLKNPAHKYDVC